MVLAKLTPSMIVSVDISKIGKSDPYALKGFYGVLRIKTIK